MAAWAHDEPIPFSCTFHRRAEHTVVVLAGEVDGDSCTHATPLIQDLVQDQGLLDLEIDLGAVTFLDSQGIRMLVVTDRALRANGGSLRLVDVPPAVRRVLEIVGLTDHFAVPPADGRPGPDGSSPAA